MIQKNEFLSYELQLLTWSKTKTKSPSTPSNFKYLSKLDVLFLQLELLSKFYPREINTLHFHVVQKNNPFLPTSNSSNLYSSV